MKHFKILLFTLLFCAQLNTQAQRSVEDSAIFIPSFNITFGGQKPGGDMADRFYENANLGFSVNIKTRGNWVLGAEGSYLFGPSHHEANLMADLKNQYGYVIDFDGKEAIILEQERGFNVFVFGGKLFPLFGPNKNSGLLIKGGVGFLQHRIWIENRLNNLPQLEGDYRKGYDRLSNGLALEQFIGYLHHGNNRLINFFIGFEAMQAFTQSRRDYNFDLKAKDETKRLDLLYGLKFGWAIPIYKRAPKEYYSE
jgi:hypothetical protein